MTLYVRMIALVPRCIFLLLIASATASAQQIPYSLPTFTDAPLREQPARLLVVAPDITRPEVQELVDFLYEEFVVDISRVNSADYAPIIDEWAHDGFVYFGSDYFLVPGKGFFEDMARTSKPVLWINYHAWNLDREALARKGLSMRDRHSLEFTKMNFSGAVPLQPTDTSWVGAHNPAKILYWLYDDDWSKALPGAVVSGNLSYVSYIPSLDPSKPDFPAFEAAAHASLDRLRAEAEPRQTNEERLQNARDDEFRAGIHLPNIFSGDGTGVISYDSPDLHANLMRIKNAGADWVTIGQTFYQEGIRASQIKTDSSRTISFAALANIVSDAHKLGLHVRLSVIVNLTEKSRGPNDWRGFIRPTNPANWWKEYRIIVLKAAKFAADNGVESFNIGAELNAMQVDSREWRDLVSAVRDVVGYRGLIGYQVNFDALDTMSWGDALDYLSISAYWPLAEDRNASLSEMITSWNGIGDLLAEWTQAHPGVELEFGEIGYASQPYAAVMPYSWRPHRAGEQDLMEQLDSYLSLADFLRKHPEIAGVGIFASTWEDMDPNSIGYSPFGKPAGEVLERIMKLR